jgi:hypothetical protein
MGDRHPRSWIVGLSRLAQAEDVFSARCRPKSEELVLRVGEGPTATDRHEAGVSDFREDHRRQAYHLFPRCRIEADAQAAEAVVTAQAAGPLDTRPEVDEWTLRP